MVPLKLLRGSHEIVPVKSLTHRHCTFLSQKTHGVGQAVGDQQTGYLGFEARESPQRQEREVETRETQTLVLPVLTYHL